MAFPLQRSAVFLALKVRDDGGICRKLEVEGKLDK